MIAQDSTVFTSQYSRFTIDGTKNYIQPIAKEFVHKVHRTNVAISEIEHLLTNSDISYFTCILVPQFNKSAFFDHENDHCSMMHLIEGCRQAALALPHKFYDVSLEGYKYLIKNLDVQLLQIFEKYSEVRLFAKVKLLKNSTLQKSFLMEFELMQAQITKSLVNGDVYIMHDKLYNKIRNNGK